MDLSQQRKDLDEASRALEKKIEELKHKRQVLINAQISIYENQENILESKSILAQETREIMYELSRQ